MRRSLTLGAAVCAIIMPALAEAQENKDNSQVEEIVVVAQKRSENLQKVPISVAVVSNAQLTAAGVISTNSLSNAVPGLSLNTTAQNFSPHIRGVGSTAIGPGLENPVSLYVDGVYYASALTGLADLSEVEQVAVLKGPQGTLFGRNATGGVIQLTTRDPQSTFSGEIRSDLDQYLTNHNFLYLTGGLAEGLSANIAIKYATQGEGWGQNVQTGEDVHKIDHDFSIRSKLLFKPSDETSIRLALDYTNQKNSLGPNLSPGTETPYRPGFGPTSAFRNPYDVDLDITTHNRFQSGGAALTVEQNLGDAKLVSISAYRQFNYRTAFNATASIIPTADISFKWSGHQISQELQLVSKSSGPFTWTAGAYYINTSEGFHPITTVLNFPLWPIPGVTAVSVVNNTLRAESVAAFGQASLEIVSGTKLTAGLRFTHEKRTQDATEAFNIPAFGVSSLTPFNGELKVNKLTWRLAIDHEINRDVLVYASYNRGFKSGGFNSVTPDSDPYRPEKIDAYEIGLKSVFADRSIRLNPSIFYYNYSDIQVIRFVNGSAFLFNGAKAEVYGADIDWDWNATERLKFNGGIEWLHAKFTKFPIAPLTSVDPGVGINTVAGDATGKRLPYAPKVTYNIGAKYTVEVADAKLDLNISDSFSSKVFGEVDNRIFQSAYHILNASATVTLPDNRLSVGIFGRNLLNKIVATQMSSQNHLGDTFDYANPPRTYGVTLRYKFGD